MNQRHVYLYSSLYVVLDRFINIICRPTWAGVTQAIYIDRSPCPASAPNQFHCSCYIKKIYRPEPIKFTTCPTSIFPNFQGPRKGFSVSGWWTALGSPDPRKKRRQADCIRQVPFCIAIYRWAPHQVDLLLQCVLGAERKVGGLV